LLIVQIGRARKIFKPVLLFDDGDAWRGTEEYELTGMKDPAGQYPGKSRLAATLGPRYCPLLAAMDGQIDPVKYRTADGARDR
jgi:hypothetical protein